MLKYVLLGVILVFLIVAAIFLVVYLTHISNTKNDYGSNRISVKDGVDTENGLYQMEQLGLLHNESMDTIVTGNMKIFSVSLFDVDKNIDYGCVSLRNVVILGSSPREANFCIAGDASISKKHCYLFLKSMMPFVCDAGSKNGTFLNGERIAEERMLHNNDILKIGNTHLRVGIV